MNCSIFKAFGAALFAAMSMNANAAIYYVKPAGGGSMDGTSWTNAFANPQDAIVEANDSAGDDVIAVAAGTYYPPGESGDRTRTFTMFKQMRMYGGFNGTEAYVDDPGLNEEEDLQAFLLQRNLLSYKTILSGDISGTPLDPSDDSYHVVTIKSFCTGTIGCTPHDVVETTQLDGFTITSGNADGGGTNGIGGGIYIALARPVIQNCDIVANRASTGGGVHVDGNMPGTALTKSHPRFISCSIRNNVAGLVGGLCNALDQTTLINCEVSGNQATSGNVGGVLSSSSGGQIHSKTVHLINCTIANNSASADGGGLVNGGNMFVYNCIIHDNTAANHPSIASGGAITIDHCNIEGTLSLGGTSTVTNVISVDPLFMSATNLRLAASSQSRNAGDDAHVPPDTYEVNNLGGTAEKAPDNDRLPRIQNGTVDHGAYENHAASTCCADINNSGCVNVDDLLAVINGWGLAGLADIAPACGGNGVVNVDDLLLVINSWGTEGGCPGPCGENDMPTSIQDCMDICQQAHPGDQQAYTECLNKCIDALCQAELIDCDE